MEAKIGKRLVTTLKPGDKPFEVNDTELRGFILRVQPSGILTYYASYRLPSGKRNRKKIGRHGGIAEKGVFTADKARDEAKKILGQASNGVDPKALKQMDKSSTLEDYIDKEYGPWVEANRKTGKATLARLKTTFPDLLEKKLSDITPNQIDKWRTERLKNGIKPATINRDLTALKAALSKSIEWGILEIHPLAKVKPSPVDKSKRVRYLEPEEEKRLREAMAVRAEKMRQERDSANKWRKARGYAPLPCLRSKHYVDHLEPMVLLSINTGLRRGEVFNLEWSGIDFRGAILTVEGTTAKSGSTRHVPLNSEAATVLKQWQDQTGRTAGLVFPGKKDKKTGKEPPMNNIKRSWSALLSEAKISDFRWHDLRHHFASWLVMAGVDLNTVRELLGHSDLKMTLRYAHLAPAYKAAAVAKLLERV